MQVEALRDAIDSGDFTALEAAVADGVELDVRLGEPARRVLGGPAVAAEVASWYRRPGRIVEWRRGSFGGPSAEVEWEAEAGPAVRHLFLLADDRWVVFPQRPRLARAWPALPESLTDAVARTPLVHGGLSGSLIERVTRADGSHCVVKHISPEWDWIMRATADSGREALVLGALRPVPEIDYPLLAAEDRGDGAWTLVLRDVADAVVGPGRALSRADCGSVLVAIDALHRGADVAAVGRAALCSMAGRLAIWSPATSASEAAGCDLVPKTSARGWEAFAELAPADIRDVVLDLVADPASLLAELETCEHALVHGDLGAGNVGLTRPLVLLDWATAGWAPPAVDAVFLLANNLGQIAAAKDDVLDDFETLQGPRFDRRALDLAIVAQFVATGGLWPFLMSDLPDASARAFVAGEFEWWVSRLRAALERTWAPAS